MGDTREFQLLRDIRDTVVTIAERLKGPGERPGVPNESRPAPTQTTGERIAEGMFRKLGKHDVGIYPEAGPAYNLFVPDAPLDVSSILRTTVAAAIDKAIADDRAAADDINAAGIADEREACAKIADDFRHRPNDMCMTYPPQNGTAVNIAARIRARQ